MSEIKAVIFDLDGNHGNNRCLGRKALDKSIQLVTLKSPRTNGGFLSDYIEMISSCLL